MFFDERPAYDLSVLSRIYIFDNDVRYPRNESRRRIPSLADDTYAIDVRSNFLRAEQRKTATVPYFPLVRGVFGPTVITVAPSSFQIISYNVLLLYITRIPARICAYARFSNVYVIGTDEQHPRPG